MQLDDEFFMALLKEGVDSGADIGATQERGIILAFLDRLIMLLRDRRQNLRWYQFYTEIFTAGGEAALVVVRNHLKKRGKPKKNV